MLSNRPGASSTWKRGSRLIQKPLAEAARLDRAERHAFDHGGKLAELVGRIDVDLDLAAGALLDAGLQPLEIFVGDVVDGRQRQLHGELLRDRGRRGEQHARGSAGDDETL